MNTVDLAAHSIASERGLLSQVQLLRPWGKYDPRLPSYRSHVERTDRWPMNFIYPNLLAEAEPAANVLFWGDFQHGWDYQLQSAKRMQKVLAASGASRGFPECFDWCMRHFMLEGDQLVGNGGMIGAYGGTLFQNRMTDYEDVRYYQQLQKLYRSAAFIRVRDPYSAWQAASLRDDFSAQFLAPDAAMLNRKDEIGALDQAMPRELATFDGAIGIYFGRSEKNFPWLGTAQFIRELRAQLGASLAWIPWDRHAGGLFSPMNSTLSWVLPRVQVVPERVEITPGDTLNGLRRMQLVITDTYHLAINCLIQGVPAVCIHEPSPFSERNANMGYREAPRDKRSLFYMTHDLVELLVPSTDLQSGKFRNLRAETVGHLAKTRHALDASFASLRRYAEHHRSSVGDYMQAAATVS